ncbi:TlpA family protein disulfide reductase [Terrimonas rubra]|uniref:TlpA family protein disulfide reductase n=1 Tax=Terrimonas rubra TaxID=1035890 RepID=A0ABW6A7N8_9BACT
MRYYTLAVISILLFAASVSAQKKIIINGQVKGVEENTKFFLMKQDGNVGIGVSKDSVINGRFRIEYTPEEEGTEQYALMASGTGFPSMSLKIWAKAGTTVTVEGNDKLIYTWKVKSNIPEQKEWAYFINANKKDWTEYQQLSTQRSALIDQYRDDKTSKDERKTLKKRMDAIDSLSNIVDYKIQKNNLAFLQKGNITPVRLEVLTSIANGIKWNGTEEFRPAVQKMYSSLGADLKNSPDGQKISLVLNPPKVIKVGQPMYDTLLKDMAGKSYRLADFKGKYILLDFWSFGCGPCHASVPEMKEIHEKLKDRLAIVGLSSDTRKIWEKATEAFKMTWYNLTDGNEDRGIYAQYGVDGIPNYVLIDPEGTVKASWTGYGEGSLKEKITTYTGFTFSDEPQK